MDPLYLALGAAALLFLGWMYLRGRRRPDAGVTRQQTDERRVDTVMGWVPEATRVLTDAERKTYELLRAAFPAHMVLAQVPVARFLRVPTRNSYAEWLRRVGHLCADFVVCDRFSQVIAVVEVRATSDSTNPRIDKRNNRLLRVLKKAAVPTFVWAEHAMPSVEQAREFILPTPAADQPPMPMIERPARVAAAARGNAFAEPGQPTPNEEEVIIMREPPSTWYDEFETQPAGLERSLTGTFDAERSLTSPGDLQPQTRRAPTPSR